MRVTKILSLRERLIQGALSSLASSIVTQVTGIVASILCARILGSSHFGELNIIRSTVLVFGVLAGTGLGMAAVKFVAEWRSIDANKTGNYVGLILRIGSIAGGSVSFICLLTAEPIATHILAAPHLKYALVGGAIMLFFNTLNGVQVGVLSGLEQFRQVAKLTAIDSVLALIFTIGGAWFFGVIGAIAGAALASIITYPLKRKYMQEACMAAGVAINDKISLGDSIVIVKFIIPSIAVGLTAQPFDWLARYILVQGDNGFTELGLFSVASTLAQFVLFLPSQLSGPTQPILANLVGINQRERTKRVLLKVSLIVGMAGVGSALVVLIFSDLIISVYGAQYKGATISLNILALSSVLCALTQIPKNYLYAQNKVWQVVFAHIVMGAVLCCSAWLLKDRGATGLAIAYVVGWLSLLIYEGIATIVAFKENLKL